MASKRPHTPPLRIDDGNREYLVVDQISYQTKHNKEVYYNITKSCLKTECLVWAGEHLKQISTIVNIIHLPISIYFSLWVMATVTYCRDFVNSSKEAMSLPVLRLNIVFCRTMRWLITNDRFCVGIFWPHSWIFCPVFKLKTWAALSVWSESHTRYLPFSDCKGKVKKKRRNICRLA